MEDTVATLQMAYDMAVKEFGHYSWQAIDAEFEARQYFKGHPAPKQEQEQETL